MIFIVGSVIFLIAVFIIKKKVAEYNKQAKEVENILNEEIVKCCYNCEFKDNFNIPYDKFKIYCKDGELHSKFEYYCNLHKYDDKTKARAKYIYFLRKKGKKM